LCRSDMTPDWLNYAVNLAERLQTYDVNVEKHSTSIQIVRCVIR